MAKKYVNITKWKDLQDDGHIYKEGTKYPRGNKKPDTDRVKELTDKQFIKEVPTKRG